MREKAAKGRVREMPARDTREAANDDLQRWIAEAAILARLRDGAGAIR